MQKPKPQQVKTQSFIRSEKQVKDKMEIIKKYSVLIGVLVFLGTVATGLIKYGEDKQSLFSRAFSSPEEKVKVIQYIEQAPSPAALERSRILDSIKNSSIISSNKFRDSVMLLEKKARQYADSINMLNADQIYQTKVVQDKILQEIEILKRNR